LSKIFNLTNKDRASWVTFSLAFIINMILLFQYKAYSGSEPNIEDQPALVILVLNAIQAAVAAFVLLQNLVVRVPVLYQKLQAANINSIEILLYTAAEPMTLYYLGYLAFVLLGYFVSYSFLPFLLLDIIVKNSTTQDVLNSVIFPRRQIAMGGIIILFIMQIYAFFLFMYFRHDLVADVQQDHFCRNLFDCYLVTLGYGLREGGGVGDVFRTTLGKRWLLDVSFYLAISLGMLNLIAGVIITTFGQLRENKGIRVADTVGVCFICNIDKQVFDRASAEPEGFKTHVKVDHNMWNYMYFIFLLWEQDNDDDDGMEQYVRRAIAANEIVWFPLNKAIRLDAASGHDDSLTAGMQKNIAQTESNISNKLEKFQTNLTIVLEQLNQALKKDMVLEGDGEKVPQRRNTHFHNGVHERGHDEKEALTESDFSEANAMNDVFGNEGRVLTLRVLSVTGLNVVPEDNNDIYCNVVFEDSTYKIESILIAKSERTVVFADDSTPSVVICELNDHLDDRPCHFNLVIVQPITGAIQTIPVETLKVDELVLAEDATLEMFFSIPDQTGQCKLSVMTARE